MAGLTKGLAVKEEARIGKSGWRTKSAIFVGSLLLVVAVMVLGFNRLRERDNRENCAFNLHQISISLLQYADNHGGAFPPTLASLITDPHVDFTFRALVCPSTADSPAPGATGDQQVHAIRIEQGHLSYAYVGNGLTNRATAATVLAYDNPHNHGDEGIEVLFGDGHVEFLDEKHADRMRAEIQSGHNPPRSP